MKNTMKLQKVAKAKADLLEMMDALVTGDQTKEEVAVSIAGVVQNLQQLEADLMSDFVKTDYMELINNADLAEENRIKKEVVHTAV